MILSFREKTSKNMMHEFIKLLTKFVRQASNLSKCLFDVRELKLLGELVSEQGIKSDPQKVSTIKDMPLPTRCPLKDLVTKAPVLKYFDSKLPTRILSDASKSGLEATLEQCQDRTWHPVAYTSRSLKSAE